MYKISFDDLSGSQPFITYFCFDCNLQSLCTDSFVTWLLQCTYRAKHIVLLGLIALDITTVLLRFLPNCEAFWTQIVLCLAETMAVFKINFLVWFCVSGRLLWSFYSGFFYIRQAWYFTEATEAPPLPLVIALVPLKCSNWNLQFPHRVPFAKEKMPWCPYPFKNEAYRPVRIYQICGVFWTQIWGCWPKHTELKRSSDCFLLFILLFVLKALLWMLGILMIYVCPPPLQ